MFKNLLFCNLLLIFILTAIIIGVFYNTFSGMYEAKIEKENLTYVQNLKESMDDAIITGVQALPSLYFAQDINPVITNGLRSDLSKDYLAIHQLSKYIKSISDTHPFIKQIDLYQKKSHALFVDGHIKFLSDVHHTLNLPEWLNLYLKDKSNHWISIDNQLIYMMTLPLFYKDHYDGILTIQVENSFIDELISHRNDLQHTLLLLDDQYQILYQENGVKNTYLDFITEQMKAHPVQQPSTLRYDDHIFSVVPSSHNGWYYVSMSSTKDFYASMNQLVYNTVVVTLLVLIVGILAAFVLAKWVYRPYKKIVLHIKKLKGATEHTDTTKSYSDHQLIEQTIDNLSTAIITHKPVIRYNKINNLMRRPSFYDQTTREELSFVDIELDRSHILCFKVLIQSNHGWSQNQVSNLCYGMISRLEALTAFKCYAIYDEKAVSGFINFDSDTMPLSYIYEQLHSQLAPLLHEHYHVVAGICLPLTDIALNSSYQTVVASEDYLFLYGGHQQLTYDELSISSRKKSTCSTNLLYKIEQAMKAMNVEGLSFLIDGVIVSLKEGHYTIEFCKNTLRDVVSRIYNTLVVMGYHPTDIFGYDIREKLSTLPNIKSFESWILEVMTTMFEYISKQRKQFVPELKEDIQIFIAENLLNNISLDLVANTFNTRIDTFSKTFKALFGETYSSYIKKVKIKKAKSLLESSNLTINEVADKLGYTSVAYFITLFKKEVGTTPKKYQLQHR